MTLRPQLTPEQARTFTRDRVLGQSGSVHAQVPDAWVPIIDGSGQVDFVIEPGAPVQPAICAAIEGADAGRPVRIGLAPGHHQGPVVLPHVPSGITLIGLGKAPGDTVLQANIDAQMPGVEFARRFAGLWADCGETLAPLLSRITSGPITTTGNTAVLRIFTNDVQVSNLTVVNTYNADRVEAAPDTGTSRNALGQFTKGQHQAVALMVDGADRVTLNNVHMKSMQDTLYLKTPAFDRISRSYLTGCDIEGDVDFIFGGGTGYFEGCTIRTLGHRVAKSWVTAPSTNIHAPYGFVFDSCAFVHDGSPVARNGITSLGRQWFEYVRATPYGTPDIPGYACSTGAVSRLDGASGTISQSTLQAVGKCVILNSRIGPHINATAPWDDWNGGSFDRNGAYTPAPWNPRFRPVQYTAADFLNHLSPWLAEQGLDYTGLNPAAVFLAEYANRADQTDRFSAVSTS